MNGKVFRTMLAIIPVFMKRIIYIFIYIYIYFTIYSFLNLFLFNLVKLSHLAIDLKIAQVLEIFRTAICFF